MSTANYFDETSTMPPTPAQPPYSPRTCSALKNQLTQAIHICMDATIVDTATRRIAGAWAKAMGDNEGQEAEDAANRAMTEAVGDVMRDLFTKTAVEGAMLIICERRRLGI